MKGIFHRLLEELDKTRPLVLTTLLSTKGSVPQVPGASALFSDGALLSGTLGGGVLEGNATSKSTTLSSPQNSLLYPYDLDGDITSVEGAICGGTALLLMDVDPSQSKETFRDLQNSLSIGKSGILATLIRGNEISAQEDDTTKARENDTVEIERFWLESGEVKPGQFPDLPVEILNEISSSLEKKSCIYLKSSEPLSVFLEPVFPLPKLYIAGAGHIGKALAHQARLLDFEVCVIDDRAEYAKPENIPDADQIIVSPIGKAIEKIPKTRESYIVVVTRGHRDDGEALRACINEDIPYLGMIGSKKKIRLMMENFQDNGWATEEEIKRVHAPIGLEIGSKTVQEIAISIAAQLVQVRNQNKPAGKSHHIPAIILAAGMSTRMGKPKMLLPFGEKSIIETVIKQVNNSALSQTYVVLGSDNEALSNKIQGLNTQNLLNTNYEEGMLSSVQCGLKSLPETTEAVMVLLGDQPMISSSVMDKMITRYKHTDKEILIASHQGKRGHPILIGSRYFKEILEFTSDQSLRDILENHPYDLEEMETENSEILRDIDTEQDYQNELKQLGI